MKKFKSIKSKEFKEERDELLKEMEWMGLLEHSPYYISYSAYKLLHNNNSNVATSNTER